MPVEEIISEYEKNEKKLILLMSKQSELIQKIKSASKEDYEWISVKEASSLLDVSKCVIYAKINAGELKAKYIGSKRFVKKSECLAINDRS